MEFKQVNSMEAAKKALGALDPKKVLKRVFDVAFSDFDDLENKAKKRTRIEPSRREDRLPEEQPLPRRMLKRGRGEEDEEDMKDLEEPLVKYFRCEDEDKEHEEDFEPDSMDVDSDEMSFGDSDREISPRNSGGSEDDKLNKVVLKRVLKWLARIDQRNHPKSVKALSNSIQCLGRTKIIFDAEAFFYLLIINEVVREEKIGKETFIILNEGVKIVKERLAVREIHSEYDVSLIRSVLYDIAQWAQRHSILLGHVSLKGGSIDHMTKSRFFTDLKSKAVQRIDINPHSIIDLLATQGFIEVGSSGEIKYYVDGIIF